MKSGYKAADCWSSTKPPRKSECWRCGKTGHDAKNCTHNGKVGDQSSCLMSVQIESVREVEDDTFATLKNGDKIPVVNTALGNPPRFLVEDLPVIEGRVKETKVRVLRDTCRNAVVVKSELVSTEKRTGKSSKVFLLDRTVKYLPKAEIFIGTPSFSGTVIAKCMDYPLYVLILGNIESVKGVAGSIFQWEPLKKPELPADTAEKVLSAEVVAQLNPRAKSDNTAEKISSNKQNDIAAVL